MASSTVTMQTGLARDTARPPQRRSDVPGGDSQSLLRNPSLEERGGEPVPADREAPDDEIEIVVAQIKRLVRTANLEFALRVGAVIIHHFYDGDTAAWRSRGPKTASFRRLAEHPGLPLSAGALYRCVALYELCDRLNAPARWQHLGATHLRLVLGLPGSLQERLLAMANSQRWTVRVLQQQVLLTKSSQRARGGRKAQSPVAKSLISVRKCLYGYREVIADSPLSAQDVEQGMQLIQEMRDCLDYLSHSLCTALATANA